MEVTGPQQNTFTDCPYIHSPSYFPPLEPLLPAHIIIHLDDSILFRLAALTPLRYPRSSIATVRCMLYLARNMILCLVHSFLNRILTIKSQKGTIANTQEPVDDLTSNRHFRLSVANSLVKAITSQLLNQFRTSSFP